MLFEIGIALVSEDKRNEACYYIGPKNQKWLI